MAGLLDVAVSTLDRLYSDGTAHGHLNKTSIEVFKYLDRGFNKPSVEGFTNPWSRYLNTSTEVFKYLGRGSYLD